MSTAASQHPCDWPRRLLLMGVAGCGKSAVGVALAACLGIRHVDGDDLHPSSNIDKMAAGHPLDDHDRWPWLDRVAVYLAGSADTVAARLAVRRGHFMPPALLASQFAALEPPEADENAIEGGIDQPLDPIIDTILFTGKALRQ